MAHINLDNDFPGIRGLLAYRPETAAPLSALADALLHTDGPLTRGEREMIAAYVSELNGCTYCRNSHAAIAVCHLLGDESTVWSAVKNPESATVSSRLKALLAVAARVQQGGRAVRAEDIARARAEGASDLEIHDTVLIAAAFCMYNRYVDGLGTWTPTDQEGYRARAAYVAGHGYGSVLSRIAAAPQSEPDVPR